MQSTQKLYFKNKFSILRKNDKMTEFIKVRVCTKQALKPSLEAAKWCGQIMKIPKTQMKTAFNEDTEVK